MNALRLQQQQQQQPKQNNQNQINNCERDATHARCVIQLQNLFKVLSTQK